MGTRCSLPKPDNSCHAQAAVAVGYLRRSTDRQEQSIPDQKRAVEQYAAEHGYRIARFYTDDGISGTSTAGRAAFQSMIADAESGEGGFTCVIVYDVKRFGRIDNDEAGYYRHLLRRHGVEVRYASEGFAGDGTDDLLRPVKQWQARQESKDLAKVTIRGLVSKATSGSRGNGRSEESGGEGAWMGGAPPYGYDLAYENHAGESLFTLRYMPDGSKHMLDGEGAVLRTLSRGEAVTVSKRDRCRLVPSAPDRTAIVREVFRLYAEERRGYKAVADAMNRAGHPTARGPEWSGRYSGKWSNASVRAILLNPAYAGDLAWNRRTDARFFRITGDGHAVERSKVNGRRLEPNDPSDWIITRNAHTAIISRRQWELTRQRLGEAGERSAALRDGERASGPRRGALSEPGAGKRRFLLSGLVECSACGSRYEGHADPTGRYRKGENRAFTWSYACGGYIRHGRSVCSRGAVRREALDEAVCRAIGQHYAAYASPGGEAALAAIADDLFGAERCEAERTRTRLRARAEQIDGITRNLLDSLTPVNRALVDARLLELAAERAEVEREAESIDRRAISAKELAALVREAHAFVQGLARVLKDGDEEQRQTAVRRCVKRITVARDRPAAIVELRALPLLAAGPKAERIASVEIMLPKVGR